MSPKLIKLSIYTFVLLAVGFVSIAIFGGKPVNQTQKEELITISLE
jgi:hypothetical protein